jgi:predicted nucleic acid-binding protein
MVQSDLFLRTRYVVDTSSFVDVKDESDPDGVWEGIFRLCREGMVYTVAFVYPELQRMFEAGKLAEGPYLELKNLKKQIVIPDAEIIVEAGRINAAYPKLGDWFDTRNRADPWIVAAAKAKKLTVVTEEADTGPRKSHKIPWVCDRENIPWIRLSRLVLQEMTSA